MPLCADRHQFAMRRRDNCYRDGSRTDSIQIAGRGNLISMGAKPFFEALISTTFDFRFTIADSYMILQIAFIHSLRFYITRLVFLPRDGKSLSDRDDCAVSLSESTHAAS